MNDLFNVIANSRPELLANLISLIMDLPDESKIEQLSRRVEPSNQSVFSYMLARPDCLDSVIALLNSMEEAQRTAFILSQVKSDNLQQAMLLLEILPMASGIDLLNIDSGSTNLAEALFVDKELNPRLIRWRLGLSEDQQSECPELFSNIKQVVDVVPCYDKDGLNKVFLPYLETLPRELQYQAVDIFCDIAFDEDNLELLFDLLKTLDSDRLNKIFQKTFQEHELEQTWLDKLNETPELAKQLRKFLSRVSDNIRMQHLRPKPKITTKDRGQILNECFNMTAEQAMRMIEQHGFNADYQTLMSYYPSSTKISWVATAVMQHGWQDQQWCSFYMDLLRDITSEALSDFLQQVDAGNGKAQLQNIIENCPSQAYQVQRWLKQTGDVNFELNQPVDISSLMELIDSNEHGSDDNIDEFFDLLKQFSPEIQQAYFCSFASSCQTDIHWQKLFEALDNNQSVLLAEILKQQENSLNFSSLKRYLLTQNETPEQQHLLQLIHFRWHIKNLTAKVVEMHIRAEEGSKASQNAYDCLNQVQQAVNAVYQAHVDDILQGKPIAHDAPALERLNTLIEDKATKSVLQHHRGAKGVINALVKTVQFLSCFLVVPIPIYLINHYHSKGRHFFFSFKTDSEQKVSALSEAINHLDEAPSTSDKDWQMTDIVKSPVPTVVF